MALPSSLLVLNNDYELKKKCTFELSGVCRIFPKKKLKSRNSKIMLEDQVFHNPELIFDELNDCVNLTASIE